MSSTTLFLDRRLYDYMLSASLRDNAVLTQLSEETKKFTMHGMQISAEQGQLMSLLIRLMKASRAIEVGVFTGYSSLCIAMALPENGELVACDTNREWTSVAKKYWEKAGVASKIKLHLAPAAETLENLVMNGQAGTFDFSFIDGDKENYDTYYEYSLKLLRNGGLIAIDNVFWNGSVADSGAVDEGTLAIQKLNKKIRMDERVDMSMLPVGDGLSLVMKRYSLNGKSFA